MQLIDFCTGLQAHKKVTTKHSVLTDKSSVSMGFMIQCELQLRVETFMA